jgi:hypothetical protein
MLARKYQVTIAVAVIGVVGAIIAAYVQRPAARDTSVPAVAPQDSQSGPPQSPYPASVESLFYPSGWMGDGRQGSRYVTLSHVSDTVAGKGLVATRIEYRPGPDGWAGIFWQYPDGNWGDLPGRSLVGAREVGLLVRGEAGGEIVEFKSGGIRGKNRDTFERSSGKVVLTQQWQPVRIGLDGADLRAVIGILAYVVATSDNGGRPVTVRLADVQVR